MTSSQGRVGRKVCQKCCWGWGVKPRMASPPPNLVMIMRALERKAKWKDTKLEGKIVYPLCAP